MSEAITPASNTPDRAKKISLAVFGGGRKPNDAEQAAGGALMGVIMGKATGFRTATMTDQKTGEVSEQESITGQFFAKFNDPSKPALRAGTLYLPGGFHDDMLDAVAPRDAASMVRKPNGNAVEFVFQIRTVQAKNPSGYSYVITPLHEKMDQGGEDMFATLNTIADAKIKALAAPASHPKGK